MSVVANNSLRINMIKLVKMLSAIPNKEDIWAWRIWLGSLGTVIDNFQSTYDFLSDQYGGKEKS